MSDKSGAMKGDEEFYKTPEGPHGFIPIFFTREQAVAWAGGDEHIARGSGLDKNLLVLGLHAEQKQEDNWNLSGDIELDQGNSQQNIQASVMLKKSW